MKKPKKSTWILLSVIVVLVIARLLLPYFVLKYVNKTLAGMKGYYGHVEDIDIWLIRGAYVINDMKVWEKTEADNTLADIPFVDITTIDLSVEWKALLKGAIVGEIEATSPKINFTRKKATTPPGDVKQDTADFKQVVKDLMPLQINRFEVNNGELHYIDLLSKPQLDVAMKNIHVLATNLTNANDSAKVLPSRVIATGSAYDGSFDLLIDLNALEKQPTFDLTAELKALNMAKLNDFLQAYANVDVKKGNFSVYAEAAAKNGKYTGYVKPIMKDLDVVQWNKEEGDFKQIVWETLVATFAEIIQNQRKEQVATKLPITGDFTTAETEIGIWRSIAALLKNAFIKALSPSIDQTINLSKVNQKDQEKKGLLEKLFDGKGKDKKKNKKDKK